jgi:hypothetical protein
MDFFPVLFFHELLVVYGIFEIYLIIVLALLFGKDGIELFAEWWGKEEKVTSDAAQVCHFPLYGIPARTIAKPVLAKNTARRFEPQRSFRNEIAYQQELYRWLNREFPVHAQVQTGHPKRKTISQGRGTPGEVSGKEIRREIMTYEILLEFQKKRDDIIF